MNDLLTFHSGMPPYISYSLRHVHQQLTNHNLLHNVTDLVELPKGIDTSPAVDREDGINN